MKIIIGIIVSLALILIGAYAYYGGFKKITPTIVKSGGETLVYEKVTGDYAQSAPVSDRVYYQLLNDFNIETTKGFGIYYDNPQEVEKEKLYSEVGCILEAKDLDQVEKLRSTFEIKEFPEKEYLTVEFPFKGRLSVMIGLMKVYPALSAYSKEMGYDMNTFIMEIWDTPNEKTIYRKQLMKSELSQN